jgi:hypothetical protein
VHTFAINTAYHCRSRSLTNAVGRPQGLNRAERDQVFQFASVADIRCEATQHPVNSTSQHAAQLP